MAMVKAMLSALVLVNAFAGTPAPQTIVSAQAPCAWGLGLAVTPATNGTAFIIANRRELLTNLHVVDRHCLGNRRFNFSHGFDLDRALSVIPATVVAHGDYCAGVAQGNHDYGGDWAVAILDRDPAAVEHRAPPSLLRPRTGDAASGAGYFLLGYGMLFRGGYHPYRAGPCRLGRRYADGVVEHDCATSPRSSGSAIVAQGPGSACTVVALNEGAIRLEEGRPTYQPGINANLALLANSFGPTVEAVARALEKGRSASEITAYLSRHPVPENEP